jgi:hypothetical protein
VTLLYWLIDWLVFNSPFNNISVISWRWILLVEKTRVPRKNHQNTRYYNHHKHKFIELGRHRNADTLLWWHLLQIRSIVTSDLQNTLNSYAQHLPTHLHILCFICLFVIILYNLLTIWKWYHDKMFFLSAYFSSFF